MRIYLGHNVLDAALNRFRWLFDEFENLFVGFSGGKDSTVILELALQVARERGRLPLDVMFLDQEAEWNVVIDYVRRTMGRSDVRPHWLQVPFRLFNATSTTRPWLHCWDESCESQWVRTKEPNSVHRNDYGVDRFHEMFPAFTDQLFEGKKGAAISGVRCQESPARQKGLTRHKTYKHVTWGLRYKRADQFAFYPIYDWGFSDVWKAIHDHGWDYCRLYDLMYQYGLPLGKMRVSSVCHEAALDHVQWMQEIEPDNWNRLTARLDGFHAAGQLGNAFKSAPKELPFMFDSWQEYRDYLLEHLIVDPATRERMRKDIARTARRYVPEVQEKLCREWVGMILVNDQNGNKAPRLANFDSRRKRSEYVLVRDNH
jgi:predicted phosphoadenosine phosphosulfate sulfurtransferase